jgi:hypothetical protein
MSSIRTIRGATVAATTALVLVAVGTRRSIRRSASNIGSQSTGAGAGKVTFNPFSIRRVFKRAQTTD